MHKTSPHRNQRLADQIQRDLAELIPRELRSPSLGLITLQSIELTPDLAHAKVFFTVLGAEPEHALKALQEKAGYLHSLLFKRLHIHTVPTLHFHYDSSVEHGIEMSRLIDQAVDSDRKDETK
jgi:ribosome-binding factor A